MGVGRAGTDIRHSAIMVMLMSVRTQVFKELEEIEKPLVEEKKFEGAAIVQKAMAVREPTLPPCP